jgi:hypothetical protein
VIKTNFIMGGIHTHHTYFILRLFVNGRYFSFFSTFPFSNITKLYFCISLFHRFRPLRHFAALIGYPALSVTPNGVPPLPEGEAR